MSLLDEYKQLQQQNSSGSSQQSGGTQRKSLLQEYVETNGTRGLNERYVDSALKNGGGFGAASGGIYQKEDGARYIKPSYIAQSETKFKNSLASIKTGLEKILSGQANYGDPDILGIDKRLKETQDELNAFRSRYKAADFTEIDELSREVEEMYEKYISKAQSGMSAYEAQEAEKRQAEEDKPWYQWLFETLGQTADTTLPGAHITQAVDAYREDDSPYRPNDDWEEYQRNLYGYLYADDKDGAGNYARYTNESNNQQAQAEKKAAIEEWATKNGFNMAAGTIASVVAMPLSLADTMDYLAQMVGRGYIATKPGVTPGQFSNTVIGSVAEYLNEEHGTLNEAIPVIGGKGWGDVYQLGTSVAESLLLGSTSGSLGTYVAFFGSASASGIENARARGATDEQAIWLGIANGLAEAAGEAFSVDKLLKTGSSATLKAFFFNILKQSGVEASEEGMTTLLNNLADQLVMQDQSEFNTLVLYYTQNGMSPEEAKKQAWKDMAESLAYDMLSGFASGGVSSTIQTSTQNVLENRDAKRIYGSSAAELVEEGLELDPSNKLANKMQGRLDKGKSVSGGQLRNLAEQNQAAILSQDKASIETAAATRLTELGETGDVQAIAKVLAKQAAGESLSRAEREIISKSKYGQRVSNELNPENIRSGEYASGWAENIGTNKINADEYNRIVEAAQIREDPAEVEAAVEKIVQQTQAQEAQQAQEATIRENQIVQEPVESVAATDESSATEEMSGVYDAETAKALVMDMAQSGADLLDYAKSSGAKNYMSEAEIESAYKAGQEASAAQATARATSIKQAANGKTGRRKGTVRGDGVSIADLNEYAKTSFNQPQRTAYKVLSTVAEATGIDIVLYKSSANEKGEFQGEQGKFKWSDNTIHIDVNSGLKNISGVDSLGKYTMLRTFSHEFVHFIEKHNAEAYNEFRKVVFATLSERGENVADLIETKIAQAGLDENGKPMSYNMASREVVAEAMTDMLPQSSFVQQLAEKHKSVFETLLAKLKEFVSQLKDYFNSLAKNPSREANALKEEIDGSLRYMEDIVKMFDKMAVKAVENYQATVATEEVAVAKTETTTAVKETLDKTEQETKVEETVAENATVEVKAEPKTSTSENGYTITDNTEYNSIEITFNEKPSEAIRDVLKSNKFRWNGKKKVWYGKTSHEAIMEALDQAYEAEKAAATGKENLQVEETEMGEFERKFKNAPQEERDEVIKALNPNTSAAMPTQIIEEEVKEDGENLDNTGTVQQPDSDRQGDTPVLETVQTGDVQGNAQGRDLVESAAERGSETARDDVRDDAAGHEGTRGDGSSQSADIRRADGLKEAQEYASKKGYSVKLNDLAAKKQMTQVDITDKDGLPTFNPIIINNDSDWNKVTEAIDARENAEKAKAEELHETVTEQIEQQSTELPKGQNFVIDESLNLPKGDKSRFRANVDAIRLIKKLNSEGRNATPAEQVILSKYVGWGGLSEAFGELTFNRETRKSEMTPKADWEKEFAELRELVTEGIITEEEYQAASKSTRNAHYTSVEVIRAMYEGLAQLGFKGGRMLEPSSGVGNFVGGMPASMTSQVKSWTLVELDRITGHIAKYLYPNSDVRIQGFERANIPDNYMDVAIGNVPFDSVGVVDKTYPKRITKSLHNYFFAKALDKVRPGGIVMFITSSFTMNGTDTTVRQYIMDRADLLGAIRLPNTAFAGNAGTQVVTDILILKKRAAGTEYAGESFLEAPYTNVSGYQGTYINEYFNNHPEMVLGTAEFARGMYGANSLTYAPLTDKGSLEEQIKEAFKHIKGKMDYKTKTSPEKANFAVERATKKTKNGGLVVNADGSISRNEDGELVQVKADAKTAKRIAGLLTIRDAYRKLANYLQQGQDAKYINQARKALNEAYDSFVKTYGYINSPANRKAIAEDPDCFAIYALENYDAENKTGSKADIFSKDTISPNRTITHVEDIASGIIVSINQTGGVDAALIAKLTGKTEESVTRELIDNRMAFKNRDGKLEAPESYLSGNVRAKLREAEALAPIDKDFENNVEELKKVIPADIPFHEIHVTPGSPWIPTNVYADFIAEMLGGYNSESSYRGPDVEVGKSIQGDFKIVVNNTRLKQNHLNTQKWGTKRRTFLDLIDAMMASRSVTVNDQIEDPLTGNKRSVVNKVETAAAQEKVEEITKEFQEWLWRDENRRNELATLYNEVFNALVTPKYDGSNLTVNGQNPHFSLRAHQADAVQRIISSGGNTLLAHKVGAGKTLEMAAAAMKLRELGIVKKPLFVVPKSLVAQWGVEFMNYYPGAKLLVSDEKSFTKANRKTYANRIANGDYDAVIVSYEQFEKIPMSATFQQEFYQEQIDEILAAIAEERAESKGKGITVKEMEKKKGQLEKKIAELTTKEKDEDNIDFELLGVDSIFVDEAHNFKNLQYVSRMNNISGLGNKDGSQRAFDLYTKVRYLQKLNGGRGIVFATATPVMNSMAEMYIMQKYLQSDMLAQLGLKSFDAWAKQFGEVVNSVEIKPSGQGFRVKQTFSNFRNLNELQLLFRSFSDVLTTVPGLKVPKMKGGKVNVVVCEPGQFQKDYMAELEKRADNVKNVDPSVDNMLKITSDGRKVSYTQRMIDPTLPYEPGCKIYRCCENVLTEYKNSKEKLGTQIIFCDMATPKGKSKTANATENTDDTEFDVESAKLYDDMRDYLQKKGIPAKEIAFIHEADTDQKKKKLFADVNEGKVRVLIGSTGKMGVGMNAQKRIVAIHHLDAPWRPGDVEQRDGRAFRQGNINEEVSKYTYVTEGSFDARLWDILDRKQHFINQIMNGEDVGRSAEDTGDVTLSAAEVKALASGNPLIEEHVKLTTELQKLESLKLAHNSNITRAKARLAEDEKQIAFVTSFTANLKEDLKARKDTYSEGKFSITIGSRKYTDKKEAGIALVAEVNAKASEEGFTAIGSFAGFELRIVKQGHEYKGILFGKQGYGFNIYESNTTYGINHLITIVEGLDNRLEANQERLKELKVDREAQHEIIAQPFNKQAELDKKKARFNEIMEILNPKEEQVISEEAMEQHQSRAYLSDEAESFREDIDAWDKGGRPAGESFILGSTGNVFQGLGAIESDVYMLSDKINTIFKDHPEMTVKEIKNLPEILENPVLVLASRNVGRGTRNNTRLTVFGMVKAQNGLPVMVAFDLHPVENHLYLADMQKVVSAYTKDGSPTAAMSLIKNSDVLYADKDKTASLLHTVGFQYAYRIEQSGYIGNISYEDDQVKVSGTPFTDVFAEETEQQQQRIEPLTDHEVLAMAASELENEANRLTDGEKDALRIFNQRLNKLEELKNKRAEEGRLYKEQQFGAKVDREAAKATLERMKALDSQIERASEEVLNVENKQVFKQVLQKARKVVERQEREHGQEVLKRWRDRRNEAADIKKYRDRIRGDVDELTNWVLHPNNKDVVKHIPDALKGTVIPFLSSINFMSKRQLKGGNATAADDAFVKQLNSLKGALRQNIDVDGLYSGYNDLPPNFMENLQRFIDTTQEIIKKSNGEFVINQMTADELRELSKMIRTLKKYIMQMNKFHVNAMYQHVYEAGDDAIMHMGGIRTAGKTGTVSNFVLWQNIRPAYAFERFGDGGKAIYDGLRKGQATLAFNTRKIADFAAKTYTEAEVKAWESEVKTIRLGGDNIKIRVSDIMSLYELSKRPQALTHILGEGIRVATYKSDGEKISDVGHTVTPDDLKRIIGLLTPRQMEVADKLQQFMAKQGGEWGNYVSVKRFGEELFGEEHYFPINSDGRHLQATADEHPSAASLYALLNMGFTKELQENANNRIILYSIFDVFANHTASMAQYNAFALPVLDALKWFNYQQKSEPDENGKRAVLGSVREQMARAYGVPEETRPGSGRQGYAESFFMNIIKAFNGTEAQGVPTDTTGMNALRRYNMAQVAFNFRVVVQQPLSITRAALLVDYDSIIKGIRLKPAEVNKNIEEMQKYSGIAAWKSLGFYDINISRGLTDVIKHNTTWRDKVSEVGMWGAEKADLLTWAGIWSACKEEVTKRQKLRPGAEGYYEAVTELFEDVIYKTQVVDSVLTKNEYLRSKGFFARAIGSFMSEPTTTLSMLVDAFDKFNTDMHRGFTRQQAWKRNSEYIIRVGYVYGIGAVLLAAVQAAADAMRDDDDYQDFFEKWLEAFGGNLVDELMPVNKLPILSDFYDASKEVLSVFGVDTYGNPPQSVFMQWWDSLIKGVEILHGKITGTEDKYTWYGGVYKLLQAASGITGLPIASAVREINTAWNNTVGAMAPSLKVKSYEPSDKNQIKYAFQDGWLSEDEAMSLLIEKGAAADENDAYWMVQEWAQTKNNSDWTRFDELYKAMLADDKNAFNDAQEALGEHGITPSNVRNEAKKQIKRWYQGTDGEGQQMDKQTAIRALQKYAGMSQMAAAHEVDEWSSLVVTGIAYDDISAEFIKGNITAYRAEEMLIKYGHLYARDAAEKVKEWQMEKDTGLSYSKLNDAYIHNDVTEYQAIDYLMQYGQLSREEAEAKILDWQAARDYGVTLGSTTEGVKKALIEGFISPETARTIMMVYDGKTAEEAEDYVNQYRFTAETGYSFSEIDKAYADGVISKAEMEMWYRDASLYTHGSTEIAKEYAEVADWKAYVPYGESMNRDGLEKWEKYGYNVTKVGLGKADFARAWGLYNASESQYDSKGNKTKEKAQVFFEKLYELHQQGVYSLKEINGIAYAVYSSSYVRKYKVW